MSKKRISGFGERIKTMSEEKNCPGKMKQEFKEQEIYKCDFCKHIFKKGGLCTACGHGHRCLMRPKNYCDTCGSPIYDNVDPKRRVTCADCVQQRLSYFSNESRLLGQKIKEARSKQGWSQRTFALAMECSQTLVAAVENGERKPTPKMSEFLLSESITKQTSCEEGLK